MPADLNAKSLRNIFTIERRQYVDDSFRNSHLRFSAYRTYLSNGVLPLDGS